MISVRALYAAMPRRARLGGFLAASALLHTLVLGVLAWRALGAGPALPAAPQAPIYIEIEPRPLLAGERPRPVRAMQRRSSSPSRSEQTLERDAPSAPAPRLADAPPADAPPVEDEGLRAAPPTADADLAARIARSLRGGAGGCPPARDGLTPAQRADCDQRFGRRAEGARPIQGTGDARRDSRLAAEGARALQQYEARRQPLSGGTGVAGPADCVGSNLGTGCAGAHLDPSLAPDSRQNIRTRRDGPRTSGAPLTPGISGAASGRD